jgi:hypothetical protein
MSDMIKSPGVPQDLAAIFETTYAPKHGLRYAALKVGGRAYQAGRGIVMNLGKRYWVATTCACGGRALRFCARCGKEQKHVPRKAAKPSRSPPTPSGTPAA